MEFDKIKDILSIILNYLDDITLLVFFFAYPCHIKYYFYDLFDKRMKKFIRDKKNYSGISIISPYKNTFYINEVCVNECIFEVNGDNLLWGCDMFCRNRLNLDFFFIDGFFHSKHYYYSNRLNIDNYIAILVNNILFNTYIDDKIYLKKDLFNFIFKKYNRDEIKLMSRNFAKKICFDLLLKNAPPRLAFELFEKIIFKKIKYFFKKMK